MIKKLICLIAILFLIVPNAMAFMGPAVAGGGMPVAAGDCPNPGNIIIEEDFENYADGEEWDTDAGLTWTESTATTNTWVGDDDDTITPYGGSGISGLSAGGHYPQYYAYTAFSEITTGFVNARFQLYHVTGVNDWIGYTVAISDATQIIAMFRIDDNGYIEPYSNTTAQANAIVLPSGVWTEVEFRIDVDDADGVDAWYLWVGGVEYGPYETYGSVQSYGIDRFNVYNPDTDGYGPFWIDDIVMYTGDRCE